MDEVLPIRVKRFYIRGTENSGPYVCDERSDMRLRIGEISWNCVSSVVCKIPLFEFFCCKGVDEDILLLLHGGNMVGEGDVVFSRNQRHIVPVRDYFHVLMMFYHGKEVILPDDLLWLVFFDNFLAMVHKKESSVDVWSYCVLHKIVLNKLCVHLKDAHAMALYRSEISFVSPVYHSQTPSLTSEERQVVDRPAVGSVNLYPE